MIVSCAIQKYSYFNQYTNIHCILYITVYFKINKNEEGLKKIVSYIKISPSLR